MTLANTPSPAIEPARRARDQTEAVLFRLRELPVEFDRQGAADRLRRAIEGLYATIDSNMAMVAHYEGVATAARCLAEVHTLLARAQVDPPLAGLTDTLNALASAQRASQEAANQVAMLQLDRRTELSAAGPAPSDSPKPFRASRGTPQLHWVGREPLVPPIDVDPVVPLIKNSDKDDARLEAPRDIESLNSLRAAAKTGQLMQAEEDEVAAGQPNADELLYAYTPAVEEAEALRQLTRDALEDIASLGGLREPLETETWLDQTPFEQRLLDNVDYFASLGAAGLPGAALYHAESEAADPARAFAIAFALGCVEGSDTVSAAISIMKQSDPEEYPGFAAGFRLAPNPAIDALLPQLLENPNAALALVAIDVLGRRRSLPLTALNVIAERNDPNLNLAFAKALATNLPRERVIALLEPWLWEESDDLYFATAQSLLCRGHGQARESLRQTLAHSTKTRIERACALLCLAGTARDNQLVFEHAPALPTPRVAQALGRYGHIGALPLLVQMLNAQDEETVKSAANSLERITKAGLVESTIEPWPVDLPPLAAEIADTPVPMRKVERVITDAVVWQQFLAANQGRFSASIKYREGAPFSPLQIVEELKGTHASSDERTLAALELSIATRAEVHLDPSDWVLKQQASLDALLELVRSKGFKPGAWCFAGSYSDGDPN